MEIKEIDINKIKTDPEQPRKSFDKEKIKELANTFKNQGIIQPIEVNEKYQIITGERRWRACKFSGLKKVPCKIVRGLTEEQKLERQLIENIHHEPLTDLDSAKAIKKLMKLKGWNEYFAAKELGINEAYLRSLLALVEAPKEIKELVKEEKLSPSDAGELIYRMKDKPKEAVKIAKKVTKINSGRRNVIRDLIAETKRRENAKERKEDLKKLEKSIKETNIDIRLGDFKNLIKNIKPNSVDLILTDPPYPKEYLYLWKALAKEAKRILKPSGFLVTYSGQTYLPKIMNYFNEYLNYFWFAGLNHLGRKKLLVNNNIINRMKPILIYYKPPLKKITTFCDLVDSPSPEKQFDEWQQSINPFLYLLDCFSKPDDLVLDPFLGTGTVAISCKKKKRKCIGFEIDNKKFEIILNRLK